MHLNASWKAMCSLIAASDTISRLRLSWSAVGNLVGCNHLESRTEEDLDVLQSALESDGVLAGQSESLTATLDDVRRGASPVEGLLRVLAESCSEVETKRREVEELAAKLEQLEKNEVKATAKKGAFSLVVNQPEPKAAAADTAAEAESSAGEGGGGGGGGGGGKKSGSVSLPPRTSPVEGLASPRRMTTRATQRPSAMAARTMYAPA